MKKFWVCTFDAGVAPAFLPHKTTPIFLSITKTNPKNGIGLWTLDYGLWNLDFGIWNLEFGK
jgi:hypothetical protein